VQFSPFRMSRPKKSTGVGWYAKNLAAIVSSRDQVTGTGDVKLAPTPSLSHTGRETRIGQKRLSKLTVERLGQPLPIYLGKADINCWAAAGG
jgi:hypothetical protein